MEEKRNYQSKSYQQEILTKLLQNQLEVEKMESSQFTTIKNKFIYDNLDVVPTQFQNQLLNNNKQQQKQQQLNNNNNKTETGKINLRESGIHFQYERQPKTTPLHHKEIDNKDQQLDRINQQQKHLEYIHQLDAQRQKKFQKRKDFGQRCK